MVALPTNDFLRWSEAAGRVAFAEELVTSGARASADAEFYKCTTFGAEVGLVLFLPSVGKVLASDTAAGCGENFQPFGRDRFAADFANDGLLPVVVGKRVVSFANVETGAFALVAS